MLTKIEKEDGDAILCFDYGVLHEHSYRGGHAVVFDRVIDDEVRIVDPWIELPKWQTHTISKLHQAMLKHGRAQMAGVWVFKKIAL